MLGYEIWTLHFQALKPGRLGVPGERSYLLPIRASAETYVLGATLIQHLTSHLTVTRTTTHGLDYTSFCNDAASTTLLPY